MPKREAVAEAGFKPGGSKLGIGAGNRKAEPMGLTALTVYTEVHDTLGHAIDIGGHAAVGAVIAGPGADNGDDGAVGADVDVVWGHWGRDGQSGCPHALVLPVGVPLPHVSDPSSPGVQLTGSWMADEGVLADCWIQSPDHPHGDTEVPEGKGHPQGHTVSLVLSSASARPQR